MREVTPLDLEKLSLISQEILQEAKRLGASQAEVSIDATQGFSVSAHGGDVETVEYNQDKAIDITVFFAKHMGTATISDIRPESIKAGVKAACHIATFTDEDLASGLAEKEELAFNYPQLDLAFPWHIGVDQAIDLAIECERIALDFDKRIMSAEESRISTAEAVTLYANSLGFLGFYPATYHEISCVLVAKDDHGMQRDFSYTISCDPEKLQSVAAVAKKAAERTVQRLGARSIRTTKAPVIFLAEEARGLLGHFATAIQGGSIYRKSSFLYDQLGKKIFPSFVHLEEQPHLSRAIGSAPFDDNGVATRTNVFVEEGVLQQYALGTYSARKLGLETTGNAGGMHNLTIRTGDKDLAQLLKTMGKGFLITELMGQGINLLTGDYSRGASGFWIENGEIQYPVNEVTVAGKLQDMYARISEIGNDVDLRGNIRTGSILIAEMTIAGD